MTDRFRETESCIFRPSGFTIKRRRGDLFEFSDLNPEVSFATKLSVRDRLRLAWWFLRTIPGGEKP